MPNTVAYNQAYYQSHKLARLTARRARQRRARADAEVVRRGPWLRDLLHLHHLTHAELAGLLHVSHVTVAHWTMRCTANLWLPMTEERQAQIAALLPADGPLAPAVLRRLHWAPLRCAAYQARWQSPVGEVTPQMIHDWRYAHDLTQAQMAAQCGCTLAWYKRWECGAQSIPAKWQEVLWWIMTGKEEK